MDRERLAAAPADEVQRMVAQLFALQMAALAQMLVGLVELARRDEFEADGCRSVTEWVRHRLGVPHGVAARLVALAHALEGLPVLAAAFAEGRLSFEVAEAAAQVATAATDAEVTEQALEWNAAQARAVVRGRRPVSEAEEADRERRQGLRWWTGADEMVELRGRLTPEDGARCIAALDREAAKVPLDPETATFDSRARHAEALVRLCSARLADDADADRATVVVHVDHDVLHGARPGAAELELGPRVSAETARRLACDGACQFVVDDEHGEPIGVGRRSRVVPPWLARLVKRRDRGRCQFPGCDAMRFLEIHHAIHWADGGVTDIENLLLVCSFHHTWIHRRRWRFVRDGHRFQLLRADGSVYRPPRVSLDPHVADRFLGDPARPAA